MGQGTGVPHLEVKHLEGTGKGAGTAAVFNGKTCWERFSQPEIKIKKKSVHNYQGLFCFLLDFIETYHLQKAGS